jgi:hypothetical protein
MKVFSAFFVSVVSPFPYSEVLLEVRVRKH